MVAPQVVAKQETQLVQPVASKLTVHLESRFAVILPLLGAMVATSLRHLRRTAANQGFSLPLQRPLMKMQKPVVGKDRPPGMATTSTEIQEMQYRCGNDGGD